MKSPLPAFLLLGFLLLALAVSAQTTGKGIWDGVYTTAQAERGKSNFATSCVRCHGAELGGVTGPSLTGARFMSNWENENVYRLFIKVRDTMPPNFGTALTDEAKLDVVAYILQRNSFPPGSEELKIDADALEGIDLVRKESGSTIPNFALVQIVGCLARSPGNRWTLTRTTEPAATRDETSTPAALKQAAAQPLGAQTFRLVSVAAFKPDQYDGLRVEARGLLYRDTDESRLNLTSLQGVSSTCP